MNTTTTREEVLAAIEAAEATLAVTRLNDSGSLADADARIHASIQANRAYQAAAPFARCTAWYPSTWARMAEMTADDIRIELAHFKAQRHEAHLSLGTGSQASASSAVAAAERALEAADSEGRTS